MTYTTTTESSSADTLTDGIYLSDSADENAILIDTDETVTLTNATVTKSVDSDGGDSYITSFTGDASQIISDGYTLYANGVALEGTKYKLLPNQKLLGRCAPGAFGYSTILFYFAASSASSSAWYSGKAEYIGSSFLPRITRSM